MKKALLLFISVLSSITLHAQQYTVSICGTVSNLNGNIPYIEVYHQQYASSSVAYDSTYADGAGNYCITFLADADTFLNYYIIKMSSCGSTQRDTIQNIYISQDTTFIHDFVCDTNTCNVTASVTGTPVSCYGGNNGTASGTVSGGTTPYTYYWNTSPVQTTASISNLPVGTYTVTVTDNNSCTTAAFYTVTQPSLLSVSTSCTNTSDSTASDGSSSATVSGGTSPYTYQWNNGATSTNITGLTAGNYSVVVTDMNGCTATNTCTVSDGGAGCSVSFTYTDTALTVYFAGSASGTSPFTYAWNFGDDSTNSVTGNPVHTYALPGTYTACVTITDTTGCSNSYCQNITVDNDTTLCSASFTYSVDTFTVSFSGMASGTGPFAFNWNFGDGATSTIQNPVHTYGTGGTYDVCLITTDANGCSRTFCYYVQAGIGCNVDYTYYEDSTQAGLFYFSGTAEGTPPFTYNWQFDDSTFATGANVNHTFSSSGYYNVCLTITDSTGCSSYACYSINNNVPADCEVFFTYYEDSINPGTVSFTSYPSGTAPFTYNWYFSDGITSSLENPVHSFTPTNGWEWAYLEITDSYGCTAYYSSYVEMTNVNSFCNAGFSTYFEDISGTPGEIFFYDYSASSDSIISWEWSFGDGTSSAIQNPTHTYASSGVYTICLTITDAGGCTNSICITEFIDLSWWTNSPWNSNGSCSAGFISYQDTSMNGLIYLIDISTGNNLYYTWDFGNGIIINAHYPFINFTSSGIYNVCLTVTDTVTGCSDNYCDTIEVDSLGNLIRASVNWGLSIISAPKPRSLNAVTELEKNIAVKLYPNPVASVANITLTLKESEEVKINVIDVTGKTARSMNISMNSGINNYSINMEDLPDGLYLLNINSAQGRYSGRMIKIKRW